MVMGKVDVKTDVEKEKKKNLKELEEIYSEALKTPSISYQAIDNYSDFTAEEHFEALLNAVKKFELDNNIMPDNIIIASIQWYTVDLSGNKK